MGLQSSAHEQVVREVCYVNAHDSKRIAVRKRSGNTCVLFVFFQHTIRNTSDTDTADCVLLRCINSLSHELPRQKTRKALILLCAAQRQRFPCETYGHSKTRNLVTVPAFSAEQHRFLATEQEQSLALLRSPLTQGEHSTLWLCLQGDPAFGVSAHLPNWNSLPTIGKIRFQGSVL